MDLKNIHTFLRVAELKSFTKVAQEMNYVQSTVSVQIQQLERELGFPLFDRIGRTVSLTAPGEEFLSYAYELVRIEQDAANLDQDSLDLCGTLRVGVLESLFFGSLLSLLPDFQATYKNLKLQLKIGQAAELIEQLKENTLDMVYLTGDANTNPDLRCCYRRREELIFLSSPTHPLAGQAKIPLSQVLDHVFYETEHSGICYSRLQALAAMADKPLHASMEVNSTTAIAELLQITEALAFLPEYFVQKHLQNQTLVKLDVLLEPQYYYSQILCHKRRWISPFMAGLIDRVRALRPE